MDNDEQQIDSGQIHDKPDVEVEETAPGEDELF